MTSFRRGTSSTVKQEMNSLSIHAKSLTSEKKTDLTLAAALRLAKRAKEPWTEMSHSVSARMVSFKRNRDYIHVYYMTGTVAMILNDVEQYFCTNVHLPLLKLLFHEPRHHATKGYKNVGNTQNLFSQAPDEYRTLENVAKNIDLEIAKLDYMRAIIHVRMQMQKKEKMNKEKRKDATVDEPVRLKVLEQPMRLKSVVEQPVRLKSMGDQPVRLKAMSMVKEIDDEPVRLKTMVDEPVRFSAKENSSLVRGEMYRVRDEYPGKNYATGIRFAVSEELHQVLDHIDMKETLCLTAIPGGGVLYSMMDGSTYWKLEEANPTNLPDVVDKALRTRSGEHSRLTSVAFGTHGRVRS